MVQALTSPLGAEAGGSLCKLKARLIYIVSSRLSQSHIRETLSQNNNKTSQISIINGFAVQTASLFHLCYWQIASPETTSHLERQEVHSALL